MVSRNYDRLRRFYEGKRFSVARARRADGLVVIVKQALREAGAEPSSIERLKHEYDVLRVLDVAGVPKALELTSLDGIPSLVVEDVGARSLADLLGGRPLALDLFLELAVNMAEIVRRIHASSVIHRDLSPENFVVGATRGAISLVDFDAATVVPAFAEMPGLPGELEGTLPYMPPEQTGRKGRLVDRRADLYALGATYYEMLTGRPPFAISDALELVHAHAARAPSPPAIVNAAIPTPVSDIVLKLLAKMPEWRYQTADALLADLGEAQHQWCTRGTIATFELGLKDAPYGLFLDPEHVYGRDEESRALEQAAECVATGESEMMLVTGPAGIGKSALVAQFRERTLTKYRWITGKGDMLRGNIPYTPFIEAFRGFVRGLHDEPAELVDAICERVRKATWPNGRALVDAIPDLKALLGDVPPLAEVGTIEAENRLHLAFVALLRALVAEGPPIVLFLDDLQWFDPASLELLRAIAVDREVGSLFVVGAYRSEEVDRDHPLAQTIARIRAAQAPVTTLELGPLGEDALLALLCNALRAQPAAVAPLADTVRRKTGGNPFFVRQFLGYLYREQRLAFNVRDATWAWDKDAIVAEEVTPNLVELLSKHLETLPERALRAIRTAACVGNRFELALLAGVLEMSAEDCARCLWLPIEQGIIVSALEGPRFPWLATKLVELETAVAPTFRFAHDRIQQAACELSSAEEKKSLHLRIGRWIEANVPRELFESAIPAIADHLDRASDRLTEAERIRLAELEARAGRQAQATAAYASALGYFRAGLALLPPNASESELHPLWFALQRSAAECASQTGDPELGERLVDECIAHTNVLLEKAALCAISVRANALRGAHAQAIRRGREGLALFGMDLPDDVSEAVRQEMAQAQARVRARSKSLSLEASQMSDPADLAKLELLVMLASSTWFAATDIFKIVSFRAAELTATRGLAPDSSVAYAVFSLALAVDGDYGEAYEYGQLAVRLAERAAHPGQECRVLLIFAGHVSAFRAPAVESVPLLQRSYSRGLESGDLEFASYALANLVFTRAFCGTPLDQILVEAESTLAFYRKAHNPSGVAYVLPFVQWVKALKGVTRDKARFDDDQFDEARFLADNVESGLAQAMFHVLRLQVSYLLGEPEIAWEYAQHATRWLPSFRSIFFQAEHDFYTALTLAQLARADERELAPKRELVSRLREHLLKLEVWARNAPANFQHKRDLVAAELARVESRPEEALSLYYASIEQAAREKFVQDEALAHELCARFHRGRGSDRLLELHLRAAADGYWRWGASAKVELLANEFPLLELRPRHPPSGPPDLDFLALLKATETLAEERSLDRLLGKLVKTCAQAAGAERAVLVLDEGGLVCRAMTLETGEAALDDTPLERARTVPISVVEHVFHSHDVLVIGDAARKSRFASDSYVSEHGVRSVLAVPIVRAEKALGVLYLENNLTSEAFTAGRATMLRLLSAHIAIALENSRLFQERERSEAALQLLSDASAKLVETIDYEEVLSKIGDAVVPAIADWYVVDVREDGLLRPIACAHADPAAMPWVAQLHRSAPLTEDSVQPQRQVLRSGRSLLVSEVTDDVLLASSRDEEQLRLLRALEPRSAMFCPLTVRGRSIGVVTFASSQPTRRYGQADLALADELARRIGLALENARLYRDVQRAMREREHALSLLQATIEATADGILVVDRNREVALYNQRFLELLGIPPSLLEHRREDLALSHILEQLEDPDEFVRETAELYAHPETESTELVRFRDGRVFERYSRPQRLGDTIVGRVWSFRDITERERLLRRALFMGDVTRLLASLDVEQALDGVAHLAVPFLGDGCAIDLLDSGAPRRLAAVSREGELPISETVHPKVLEGESVTYALSGIPYLGVPLLIKGKLVGAITLAGPPTGEYTSSDQELVEALARRAALAIENARLYRGAQDALRARDELLSIAAHEIRGPITSIHLAVQSLRTAKVPSQVTPKLLDLMEREDRRLSHFVDELLDLGRIRAGAFQLECQEVDLAEVVREVAARFGPQLAAGGSSLSITVQEGVVGQWDKSRLDQVVTNLLSNAMKFGRGKAIEIMLAGRESSVQLVVRDHGIGMTRDVQGRIFAPFERGVSVRQYGGLGLGLHIVKTIVDALGGTVSVESEPGVGTTFTVELPRLMAGAQRDAHPHSG